MEQSDTSRVGRNQGRMVFAVLGMVAMMAWCAQAHAADLSSWLLVLLGGVTLSLWGWRDARADRGETERVPQTAWTSQPRCSVVLEGGLCLVGVGFNLVLLLALIGHLHWLAAAVLLTIGVLCLPFGAIQRHPPYYWAGGALMVLALAGSWFHLAGVGIAEQCFAAGLVCWVSALYGFWCDRPVVVVRERLWVVSASTMKRPGQIRLQA